MAGIERRAATVVLSLHRVSPERNDFYPPIHPHAFEALVSFLVRRFRVTTFGGLRQAEGDRRPAAVLSFDDGYHDFVEYALPVLERHGLRANQNVILSTVLDGTVPWTQRLMDGLAGAPPALLREIRLPGLDVAPPGPSPRERETYGIALVRHLTQRTKRTRAPLIERVERTLARADRRDTRMMDLRDVREAAAAGHEIGAHSYDHDPMDVETIEDFRADVVGCERAFGDRLALPLGIYAFPFGRHRREQVDELLRRGVGTILLVGDRYASRTGPVYPRLAVGSRDPYMLRLEALGIRARGTPPLPAH